MASQPGAELMREIPVKNSPYSALVDDEDYARLVPFPWRSAKKKSGAVYAVFDVRRGDKVLKLLMHREVLRLDPQAPQVDHRNRNGLDNRKENLRLATSLQNSGNHVNGRGTSLFRGVSWDQERGLWRVQIRHDGVNFWLGRYRTEKEAVRVYDAKALALRGDFACTNLPIGSDEEHLPEIAG